MPALLRGCVVALYLGAIVAANLISAHFGADASIVNAFVLVGLVITTRDYLHDLWRRHRVRNMALLIASGSALSYLSALALASDALPSAIVARIALASCAAFAIAETLDALAYQALRHREWLERSNASNIVSAAFDSLVFVSIAFGFDWRIVFGQFCAKVAGGFIWSWLLANTREHRVARASS